MPKMQPEQLKQAGNKAFAAGNIQAALGASRSRSGASAGGEGALTGRGSGAWGRREQGRGGWGASPACGPAARATLLSNRALCLGKVGEHAEALRDAEGAIAADPTFAKAWVRKGNALLALGRR